MFGRLEHHAVTGGQCRCDFPGGHVQREVPGYYGGDDTERHTGDGRQRIGTGGGHLIVELVEALAVPGKYVCCTGYVDVPGIRHRLAHAQRIEQGQLFAVGQHQLGQAQQHLLALTGCHPCPGPLLKRFACTAHRQVDLDLATGTHFGQHLVGRRVDHVESAAGGGSYLDAVDQRLVDKDLAGGPLLPVVEI
ncbi:hypothetical protein D9M71_599670 [compost metagenome]